MDIIRILRSPGSKPLIGSLSASAIPWLFAVMTIVAVTGCEPKREHVLDRLPPPVLKVPMPRPRFVPPPPVPVLPAPVVRHAYRNVTIVVDAGHGGHDPGTRGVGYTAVPEKNINLAIATDLAQQLRSRGANVVMTRASDCFIELGERANTGDRCSAELFVSIHIDASRNTGASGMTVYMGKSASVGSQQAARHINNALRAAGLETRGVRRANYKVLRESNCSAVLIECGFLSNYRDAQALTQPYHQQRIATAIAEGIADFFGW